MNTTHRTARITAVLLSALAAAAISTSLASAASLSRPPALHSAHVGWYRWHPTARVLHRHFGSKIVLGLASMRDLQSLRVEYGFQHVQTIPALHAAEVQVNRAQLHALLTRGTHDPRIRYVSPLGPGRQRLSVPNDPYLSTIDASTNLPYEWTFFATHVDQALQFTQGDPSLDVGIIDSGISYIPDLAGKIDSLWTVHGTTVTQDFTSNDQYGHGTMVASVIAANDGDGFGMAGFGGATHIIGVHTTDGNGPSIHDTQAAVALTKLVSLGVRIVNMSFGGSTPSEPPLVDAIHLAAAKGVLLIAAAGNDGRGSVSWPAADLQPSGGGRGYGLVVGATDVNGNRATFSNWGDRLSLMAPGTYDNTQGGPGVLLALPPVSQVEGLVASATGLPDITPWLGPNGSKYTYASGTSFSAPEVAGVAALILAARPDLTNYQVADILKESAHRESADWTPGMGCGILDAGAALELATSRPASAWAETPNADGAACSALGNAPATWPTESEQTITFAALPNKHVGDHDFTPKASASSGLPVSFAASGTCSMKGSKVHILGKGWCTVTASQGGDATYNFATPVTQRFFIAKRRHVHV
jgi:subtilisin family serine protease